MSRRPTTSKALSQSEMNPELDLDPRDEKVMAGRLDNLPPLHSRLVRIFTSSTFTDTQVERNELMEHVYPRIKEYCRQRHRLEFQVVDMRWGVTDEATDDHMTVDVCLNEISNCQKVSVGPNFVLFLGMKYGYRPVPRVIPRQELELLRDVISANRTHLSVLDQWYILDTNAQPPEYILLPISIHLPYFNKKNMKTLYDRDQSEWWDTLNKLQKMFREAVTKLYHKNKVTAKQYHNYFMSVTEREITNGILHALEPSKHCLIYFRKISDIAEVPPDKARNFIDISYNKVDAEPQLLLENLRGNLNELMPERFSEDNFKEYQLEWRGMNGIEPQTDEIHKDYLESFCKHFEANMIRLIDESVVCQQERHLDETYLETYSECLQHLHACNSFCKVFQGREDILIKVREYLQNPSESPMVIYGQSGCGKTSIMAKAYSQILDAIVQDVKPVTVLRFLGTSPHSSVIVLLLRSICQQIAINYRCTDEDVPTEMSLLIQHFRKMLALATKEKPMVIFLDSVDQLSTVYESRKLSWVPKQLPPHVKIVFSTLPHVKDDNILETFQKKLPKSQNFVEVKNLGEVLSKDILESWLKDVSRTVTPQQQQEINRVLQHCSLPLFLRLVFDQICSWRSFDKPDITQLSTTIHDSISRLFDKLELRYGKMFASNTFAYITLSRNGFSETELEDILSLDDDVLNAVYQYHRCPVRRIPPLLWTRLKSEIPNYLTEREADGITVINWYHRQFFEVAKARYLQNMNIVKKMHSLLSDYFLGTWAGIPKPFRYTEDQKKMFFLSADEMNSQADRHVPDQPLLFINNGVTSSYNLRKLSQLPYHLLKAERIIDLEESLLLNFKWLHAKLEAQPLQSVLGDFKYVISKQFDPQIKIILDSLRLSGSMLTKHPNMLGIQLIGRLIPYYPTHSKIRHLINSCDRDGAQKNALIPAYHCLHTPGGPLQYSLIGHPGAPFGIVVTSDKKYLISVSRLCIIWDIDIGDVWRQVEPKIRGIMQGLSLSPDDQRAVCFTNPANQVVIIEVMTGEITILPNPFDASDKVRGLRCTNVDILVWSSTKWQLITYDGQMLAHQDFTKERYTVLDIMISTVSNLPIVKLQSSDGRSESSCVLRMADVEDFKFSTCVILNTSHDMLYACSVQHTAPNSARSSQPQSRYATISRFSTAVTQYRLHKGKWEELNILGDTAYTVYSLNLSPDGSLLAACIEVGFVVWKTTSKKQSLSERIDLSLPSGKKNFPGNKSCVFSRGNEYLMASSRKTVFVYDLERKELVREITAHFDRILDMISIATMDKNIAITSSTDHSIKIWNFNNIRQAVPVSDQHEKEIENIAVAGQAGLAVCVTRDSVGVWNTSQGNMLHNLHPPHNSTDINTKSGDILKMSMANITEDGRFIIGADNQKLTFWESDEGEVLHTHDLPQTSDGASPLIVQQIILVDNKKIIVILKTKPKSRVDQHREGAAIVFTNITWEVVYDFKYGTRVDCPVAITTNGLYIVVPACSPKNQEDCLSIWHLNTGTYLYDINLKHLDGEHFIDLVTLKHEPSQVVVVTPSKGTTIEVNRKSWKKGNFILQTFVGWRGHCTSDGEFGIRKTPDSKSLEMFSFATGRSLKTLFSGKHPGDTEGMIFITKNNHHMVYYQPRHRNLRLFRLTAESNKQSEIAMLHPDAHISGLCDSNGGTDLVVGLSDGRLMVFIIADPDISDNQKRLHDLRNNFQQGVGPTITKGSEAAKNSMWAAPINVVRLAAKAKIAKSSNSKVCVIS